MGSGSSSRAQSATPTPRPPGNVPSSARRSTRFTEVQLSSPEGAASTQRPSQSRGDPSDPRSRSSDPAMAEQWQRAGTQASRPDEFSDLGAVAGQMMRERTMFTEDDRPKYESAEAMAMETFFHRSGATYSCLYQGGQRFYLDSFNTQDWQPFPSSWFKEGILATDRIIDDESEATQPSADSAPAPGRSTAALTSGRASQYAPSDDREGFIDHPTKGRLQTYVFEEKKNVHYYFDKDTGGWVRLPVSWELHSDMVKQLLSTMEEAAPDWTDTHDMLASLRVSNYDPQDCIATYLTTGDQSGLKTPKNKKDAKALEEMEETNKKISKDLQSLKTKIKHIKQTLKQERDSREDAEEQVKTLRDCISTLEVNAATATAQLEALQRDAARPKTARPPSARRSKTPAPLPEPENQVEPETLLALNSDMKLLHKSQIKLKMEAGQKFEELRNLMQQISVGFVKIRLCDSGQDKELTELRELYRKEALQRKLLYNKLQELRGNIRVFCRCRYDSRTKCCLEFPTDREVQPPGGKKGQKFDRVFTPQSTQVEVFEEVSPIITSCIDGYNVSLLAYGQTGSGKTYTMQGPSDDPGVNVRALKELLKICQEKENIDYTLTASMVEIYNETIQDLLTTDVKQLDIRTHGNKIVMPGITEMEVNDLADIERILKLGEKNRSTAATKMNSHSSRSHLIFMITVQGRDKTSGAVSTGTLTLCDLAGSERVAKTEATGKRLVEAAAINKSLSSLGQVFSALKTGQLHVPFRNSKLTHILQPSLSGDAKACLFVAVSPDQSNIQETVSTLQFGSSARQVALGQVKQNVRKAPANGDGF